MPLKDHWSTVGNYTHLGFSFAASTLVFFFIGYWLDGKLGTMPWLAIILAMLGAAGGFANLILKLNRLQAETEEQDRQEDIGDKK